MIKRRKNERPAGAPVEHGLRPDLEWFSIFQGRLKLEEAIGASRAKCDAAIAACDLQEAKAEIERVDAILDWYRELWRGLDLSRDHDAARRKLLRRLPASREARNREKDEEQTANIEITAEDRAELRSYLGDQGDDPALLGRLGEILCERVGRMRGSEGPSRAAVKESVIHTYIVVDALRESLINSLYDITVLFPSNPYTLEPSDLDQLFMLLSFLRLSLRESIERSSPEKSGRPQDIEMLLIVRCVAMLLHDFRIPVRATVPTNRSPEVPPHHNAALFHLTKFVLKKLYPEKDGEPSSYFLQKHGVDWVEIDLPTIRAAQQAKKGGVENREFF